MIVIIPNKGVIELKRDIFGSMSARMVLFITRPKPTIGKRKMTIAVKIPTKIVATLESIWLSLKINIGKTAA